MNKIKKKLHASRKRSGIIMFLIFIPMCAIGAVFDIGWLFAIFSCISAFSAIAYATCYIQTKTPLHLQSNSFRGLLGTYQSGEAHLPLWVDMLYYIALISICTLTGHYLTAFFTIVIGWCDNSLRSYAIQVVADMYEESKLRGISLVDVYCEKYHLKNPKDEAIDCVVVNHYEHGNWSYIERKTKNNEEKKE